MNSFQNPSLGPGGMTPGVNPQQVPGYPTQQPPPQQVGGYSMQQPQQVGGFPVQQPLPQQGVTYPVHQPSPQQVGGYPVQQPPPQQSAVDEQWTVSPGLDVIPPGSYTATFVDCIALTMSSQFHPEPQAKRRVIFELVGGPHNGKRVDVLANALFSPKSTLFKWACMLLGRQLQEGEQFSFSQLKGRQYSIVVQQNAKGFSNVVTAIPLNPQQ